LKIAALVSKTQQKTPAHVSAFEIQNFLRLFFFENPIFFTSAKTAVVNSPGTSKADE
jgi:hypothetical protein